MFNFAWSELALIAIVALVLIGPKDLPVAVRAVARVVRRLRAMAAEFQGHVDEMVREADLAGMRDVVDDMRALDLRGQVARVIDPDRAMARAMADPFGHGQAGQGPIMQGPMGQGNGTPLMMPDAVVPPSSTVQLDNAMATPPAPAFVPPGTRPPAPIQPIDAPGAASLSVAPPAFVPPGTEREY